MSSTTSKLVLALAMLFSSCGGPHHDDLMERIKRTDADPNDGAHGLPATEHWLADLDARPSGDGTFLVRTRREHLVQYPCSQCHRPDLPLRPPSSSVATNGIPQSAHFQIVQPHGKADTLACGTCHHPDDPAQLQVAQSTVVGFDESYRLCAICHFEQHRDWQAGAHGKRLATWSGPRVIESCTGCHDPHAPSFEVRMPTTVFVGAVDGDEP